MRTRLKTFFISILVMGISTVLCITLADQAMRALGYPATLEATVSHPPNAQETRKNVEYEYQFATNDIGLRNAPIAEEKPDDVYRVLVVGDSFVEGMGVPLEDTFTSVMSDQLNSGNEQYQLINAGFSGQGPTEYSAIERSFADKLDVDAVIITLYANDLWDTKLPKKESSVTQVLNAIWPRLTTLLRQTIRNRKSQSTYAENTADENFVDKVIEAARNDGIEEQRIRQWQQALPEDLVEAANRGELNGPLLSFGLTHPKYWSDSILVDTPEAEQKWSVMQETLTTIQSRVRADGREIAFVYIPSVFQYNPRSFDKDLPWPSLGSTLDPEWLDEEVPIVSRLNDLSAEINVPFLDLTAFLRDRMPDDNEPLNFRFDEHFTQAGHRVVGEYLADWFEQNVATGEAAN